MKVPPPAMSDPLPNPLPDGAPVTTASDAIGGLEARLASATAELAAERALLHALLDCLPDRIYFKDRASKFLRVSKAMATFFGLGSPENAIGKDDFDFFTDEHASQAFGDEQEILRTGRALIGKTEKETRTDGSVSWVHTTKLPLGDSDGNIVGTFGISRDITELKHLEDALAAERNLLRSVIDQLPDPVFVKNKQGKYVLDNQAHARFLGLKDAGDAVGRGVADFFPPEFVEKVKQTDAEIIATGKAMVNVTEELVAPNGQPHWMVSSRVPLHDEKGAIVGVVCIRRDITAEKRAQQELELSNVNLLAALAELRQAHRDLRAMQLQLIEAEKMKSVGRLSAGVAHEVKNPLAIMAMGVEFLRGCAHTDPVVPEVLAELQDAVRRADMVVRGLLDFSAPRQVKFEAHDLNPLIERAFSLVRGERRAGLLTVQMELGDLPPVHVDPAKISQVFINLFTNATDAMEGTGTLSVRTHCERLMGVGSNIGGPLAETFRAGDFVVVAEVADTGPGIPEDKLAKIFEPFYTTKPTGKGTGLGMSVVKSIMDMHGGTIEVANRPEGGILVRLVFKCVPEEVTPGKCG